MREELLLLLSEIETVNQVAILGYTIIILGDDIMARMTCICGAKLDNHDAPNDVELRVYTDKEWEDIFDGESIQPWMIPLPKYNVWRCPACKRIYVYEKGNDSPIMVYCLEKE